MSPGEGATDAKRRTTLELSAGLDVSVLGFGAWRRSDGAVPTARLFPSHALQA